jgi:2-dehydropantoate 2-reductase
MPTTQNSKPKTQNQPSLRGQPRIAVVGSGALGLYYGARLSRAGADVRFLMRSDLAALRARDSILVHLKDSNEHLEARPVQAFASTPEIGPVDLVLVTLKTTVNHALAQHLPPLIGPHTAVLTLQNGLGSDEYIASLVGAPRVLSGLAFIASTRTAPAEVTVYHSGSITLGEFSGPATERTQALAHHFRSAGIVAKIVDNVLSARWHKLVWNIPFNGLAVAAGGITTDQICADPVLVTRARALMKDVQHAAAAFGIAISDDFLRQQFDVTPPMGAYQPSSLVDYRASREVEIESIWGEPLRRARSAGVAVPELAKLYQELRDATRITES